MLVVVGMFLWKRFRCRICKYDDCVEEGYMKFEVYVVNPGKRKWEWMYG
jgi:hypothetical protein